MIDIRHFKEFDNHADILELRNQEIGLRGFIAFHREGPKKIAFGATRLWKYANENEAIRDALRLSRTMTYKSAFVGLPYGGAKAVLMDNELAQNNRAAVFKEYAKFIESLKGRFITGTDAGLLKDDLKIMTSNCNYIVGTKVNPEHYTSLGIYYAIESGLEYLYGTTDMRERSFAILGLGKVGQAILGLLYDKAKAIYVSDIDKKLLENIKQLFPKVIIKESEELLTTNVDILVPCAVGVAVNWNNVNDIQAKAIIGGSNNQLEDDGIGEALHNKGILYAPDFIVNAGGLISVVHEYENPTVDEEKIQDMLFHIKDSLRSVFEESQSSDIPVNIVAQNIAERFYKLK